jgi:hypothetical protein
MAPTTVFEISRKDLQELDTPKSASITDVKHLSSYNWLEAPHSTPTIAVPGSPARWLSPGVPHRLKKDSGLIYIAQNAARHPESPLEPLFRALYITHPSFNIHLIDVVTDRNNIRKLLSFIDPSSNRNGLEEFTINIEVGRIPQYSAAKRPRLKSILNQTSSGALAMSLRNHIQSLRYPAALDITESSHTASVT